MNKFSKCCVVASLKLILYVVNKISKCFVKIDYLGNKLTFKEYEKSVVYESAFFAS